MNIIVAGAGKVGKVPGDVGWPTGNIPHLGAVFQKHLVKKIIKTP